MSEQLPPPASPSGNESIPPPKRNRSAAKEAGQFVFDLVKTVIIVGVLAFAIRTWLIQPFIVDGSSMYPTLHNQDYLLVDKISYQFHQPARGDIVVFRYPLDPTYNYVKRVIAFPGEKVHIADGQVTIINNEHPNGVILNEPYVEPGNRTLPSSTGQADFTVAPGNYFVLGDNRLQSSDSREWGDLPQSDLIGRVVLLAWPLNRFDLPAHPNYSQLSLLPVVWASAPVPPKS